MLCLMTGKWLVLSGDRVLGTLGMALVLLLACGGKLSGDETSDGESKKDAPLQSVAKSDFTASFARTFCESMVDCCARFGIPTDATCTTNLASHFAVYFAVELSSDNVAYDATAAASCMAAYGKVAEACTDVDAFQTVNPVCSKVFTGNVALGGNCTSDRECSQNDPQSVSCTDTGKCVSNPEAPSAQFAKRGVAGDPCQLTCFDSGGGTSSCVGDTSAPATAQAECWVTDGLVCGPDYVCAPAPTLGDPCSNYCAGEAYCNEGTCAPRLASGSCAWNSIACMTTAYCDFSTTQCRPKRGDGLACDFSEQCAGGECYEGTCRVRSLATAALCSGKVES